MLGKVMDSMMRQIPSVLAQSVVRRTPSGAIRVSRVKIVPQQEFSFRHRPMLTNMDTKFLRRFLERGNLLKMRSP